MQRDLMDFVVLMLLFPCMAQYGILQPVSGQVTSIPNGSIWISTGKFDPDHITPLCSHTCFSAIGDTSIELFNRPVGLYRCFFSFSRRNHCWVYNNLSKAITISEWRSNRPNATYCLDNLNITTAFTDDVKNFSAYPMKVTNCTGKNSQQWSLQNDGRIRSAIQSQTGEALYVQASFTSTGNGMRPLVLGPASDEDGKYVQFTWIPVPMNGSLLSAMMATIPSPGDGSNLVSNGGFEVTAPRNTSVSYMGAFLPGEGDICYWSVGGWHETNDAVDLNGSISQEGSNSLILGYSENTGAAMVTQVIRTRPGNNYSLSFFLTGSSDCNDLIKTMTVQLSPATNASQFIADAQFPFKSQGNDVGWDLVSLNFTALSEATNLSFINGMSDKSCPPLIDKVAVVQRMDISQGEGPHGTKDNHRLSTPTIVGIIVAIITTAGLIALFFMFPTKGAVVIKSLKLKLKKNGSKPRLDGQYWKPGDDMPHNLGEIRTYTLEELAKSTNNFSTKVGEGGFGAVYRANLEGNRIGAVKRATRAAMHDPQVFKEELSVLLRLRHPYLVNLIGFCFERGEQILVFEFIRKGSLYDRLHTERELIPLSWAARMEIAFQVAVGLQYLHEDAKPAIVHRDIKSSDVLLVEDNQAKLADFGLSKLAPRENQATFAAIKGTYGYTFTTVKGSYGYTDPQYMKTGMLSVKSDVYSFGVLLLELMTGLKSVQGTVTLAESTEPNRLSDDIETVLEIVDPKLDGKIDLKELESVLNIANLCVLEKGESRPSMSQIVRAMRSKRDILDPNMNDIHEAACLVANASHDGGVMGIESASVMFVGR